MTKQDGPFARARAMVVDRGKGKGDGKGKGGGKGGTAAERRGKGSLDRSGTCSVSSRSILVSKHAIMAHVEDENTFVNVRVWHILGL